jgi:hypothetical protein
MGIAVQDVYDTDEWQLISKAMNAKKKYLHYKLTITNDPLSCDPVDLSQF